MNPVSFTWREQLARCLWILAWHTVWQIVPHRIYVIRAGILRLFGADVPYASLYFGSTWIEIPWRFKAGRLATVGPRTRVYNLAPIEIGERTVVSQDGYLCSGSHDYTRASMPLVGAPIVIGPRCWICAGVFVHPGVTVGEGSVVGARSVVTADLPPWMVCAGTPCRPLKKRDYDLDS